MYTSVDIATVFTALAKKEQIDLTKTKLIKLCYIAHGYHLGVTERPLFSDEIEAWQYGPVMPFLYAVCNFKPQQIKDFYKPKSIKEHIEKFIKRIWDMYKTFSATDLVELTHKKGSPWYQVYDEYDWNKPIENVIIQKYYKKLVKRRKK